MSDVLIQAPAAVSGLRVPAPGNAPRAGDSTEADLLQAALRDNARLRRDLRELGDAASSISSVCLALTRMLLDNGHGSPFAANRVDVPRGLHLALVGATVKVGEDKLGNITVELVERARERVVVDRSSGRGHGA